jgi:glycosyltransferase involved in cell wall biosynthesis
VKVTIITAAFNCAGSVASTLHSVAQQDHPDVEHIVVDGGSTDGTLDMVRANGGRVAHVISEPDDGVYDAFNKGLRLATGDAIAYLNSGDVYTSAGAISRAVAALSEAGVQATFSDVLIVDPQDTGRVLRRYDSKGFTPGRMSYGFMPAHPSLFFRREVYSRVGEYNPSFRIAADFELCLRAFVKNKIAYRYVNEATVRMPNGGLSNQGWRSKWLITREMRRACELNGVKTSYFRLFLRFPIKVLELR